MGVYLSLLVVFVIIVLLVRISLSLHKPHLKMENVVAVLHHNGGPVKTDKEIVIKPTYKYVGDKVFRSDIRGVVIEYKGKVMHRQNYSPARRDEKNRIECGVPKRYGTFTKERIQSG